MNNLPDSIKLKLSNTESEIEQIITNAQVMQKTTLSSHISFCYKQSAPMDILSPFERAQSVCFISRYEHLPIFNGIEITEREGKFYVKNTGFLRHIINEYRSVISNQDDSIHYKKIHKFCFEKLRNRDPNAGLSINVTDEDGNDVTAVFIRVLGENNNSISEVLANTEFGYIYNGILQHSDHKYTQRFWKEYHSGQLNYVFIKHAAVLVYIKDCLYWHYKILNQLTFPMLGPL